MCNGGTANGFRVQQGQSGLCSTTDQSLTPVVVGRIDTREERLENWKSQLGGGAVFQEEDEGGQLK